MHFAVSRERGSLVVVVVGRAGTAVVVLRKHFSGRENRAGILPLAGMSSVTLSDYLLALCLSHLSSDTT